MENKMWISKFRFSTGKERTNLVFLCLLLLLPCLKTTYPEIKNQSFATRLYKAISEDNIKEKLSNLIISPISLEILLAVAGLGAAGDTKRNISRGLNLSLELSTLKTRFSPVLFGPEGNRESFFHIYSKIFVEQRFSLNPDFVNASVNGFDCGTQLVDFASRPNRALSIMNSWIEEKSEGLIKNLFDSDSITSDTTIVLLNAIYFKGKWASPFNTLLTKRRKFQLHDGENVYVDMMQGEMWSNYGHPKSLEAKVIELPYVGDQLSMIVMLPDRTSSVTELERKITSNSFDLSEIISNHTRPGEMYVTLPRFKLELKTNLENSLEKLGMGGMFSNLADFSGMSTNHQGMKVSKVVQKAFIEVSEEGTEAAAATGIGIIPLMASVTRNFRANRPFIFFLLHKVSKTILFVGRVADPTKVV